MKFMIIIVTLQCLILQYYSVNYKVNMSKIRCGERNFCFPPNFFIFILADNVFCRFDCWILDFSTLTFITFLKGKEESAT